MTSPWLPGASEPITGVPGVGAREALIVPVAATVMPIASVAAAVTVTVTD
jgi:hypothetical protein